MADTYNIEDDPALLAGRYTRPLRYVYDKSLKKEDGAFRFVFDEGGLRCSEAAEIGDRECLVSSIEMTSIAREDPGFVYANNGAWLDNADGKGTKRRNFVVVCGPNVYLCEFNRSFNGQTSRIPSVQKLLSELNQRGCGIYVVNYIRARDMPSQDVEDRRLFLFLGDLHLPPVSWFYTKEEVTKAHIPCILPSWLAALPGMNNQLMRDYFAFSQTMLQQGYACTANADIFQNAGNDLVSFLNALAALSFETKQFLHVIQNGDMFELWVNRDYQYKPGIFSPQWIADEAPNRTANWALEVLIQNVAVIEAFDRLERSGLAEVKYLWGNHDAYMMNLQVSSPLRLFPRRPAYEAMLGSIFCEHGHRFDTRNFDNKESGSITAKLAYLFPVMRRAEKLGRDIEGVGHPQEEDCYLLGATLLYLYQRYELKKDPFSIYIIGHTHAPALFRFHVRADFHLYEGSG